MSVADPLSPVLDDVLRLDKILSTDGGVLIIDQICLVIPDPCQFPDDSSTTLGDSWVQTMSRDNDHGMHLRMYSVFTSAYFLHVPNLTVVFLWEVTQLLQWPECAMAFYKPNFKQASKFRWMDRQMNIWILQSWNLLSKIRLVKSHSALWPL